MVTVVKQTEGVMIGVMKIKGERVVVLDQDMNYKVSR